MKYCKWIDVCTDSKHDDSVFKVIYEIQAQSHDGYCSGVDDDECDLGDKRVCIGYLPEGEYMFDSNITYNFDPTGCLNGGSGACARMGDRIKVMSIVRLS